MKQLNIYDREQRELLVTENTELSQSTPADLQSRLQKLETSSSLFALLNGGNCSAAEILSTFILAFYLFWGYSCVLSQQTIVNEVIITLMISGENYYFAVILLSKTNKFEEVLLKCP